MASGAAAGTTECPPYPTFPETTLDVLVMPYASESTVVDGTTLARLIAADLLQSTLQAGVGVSEVFLPQADELCLDPDEITDALLAAENTSVIVWGDIYEDGPDVRIATAFRIIRDDLARDVDVPLLGQSLGGRLSSDTIVLEPRRLSHQEAADLTLGFNPIRIVSGDSEPSKPPFVHLDTTTAPFAYRVEDEGGDWLSVRSPDPRRSGWIRVPEAASQPSPLKRALPELSLVQAVVAHLLTAPTVTGEEAARIEAPIRHFLASAEEQPRMVRAVASQLLGIARLAAGDATPDTTRFFDEATELVPSSADARNLSVVAGLRNETMDLASARDELRTALSFDYENTVVMDSLDKVVGSLLATAEPDAAERSELRREQDAVRSTQDLLSGDPRPAMEANVFAGVGFETFAAAQKGFYLNPEASADLRYRASFGTNLSYRLWGDPLLETQQVWIYSRVQFGGRSTEGECTLDALLAICSDLNPRGLPDLPSGDTDEPKSNRTLFVLRNARSLEAFSGFRWEFATLQRASSSSARLYMKAELGFVNVEGAGKDISSHNFVAVGLRVIKGPYRGSHLEIGSGRSDLFLDNINFRFKLDARFAWNIDFLKNDRLSLTPFLQMSVDSDLRSGSDSIQSYAGIEYRF
jgi:hypothetical protein